MRSRDMFLPQMPSEEMALPGRTTEMKITDSHYILGSSQIAPEGNNLVYAMFGMGCFWGAAVSYTHLTLPTILIE